MKSVRYALPVFTALWLGGCTSTTPVTGELPDAESIAGVQPAVVLSRFHVPDGAGPDELKALALKHHPELLAADAEVEAAEAEAVLAGALMDPQLSLGVSGSRQRLALEQRIPLFGKRRLAREQAAHRAEAARARRDQRRLEIAEAAVARYADHAYVLAAEAVLHEQLELLAQLTEVVRVRYQSGAANQAELLRMQNARDSLANDKANLRNQRQAASEQLNVALGRPAQVSLPPLQPLVYRRAEFDEKILRAHLEERNPELRALLHELAAAESGRELAGRAGTPDLMLGIEHMRDEGMSGSDTGLMLGVNLPVWRGTYRAERRSADAAYRATQARHRDLQEQLQARLTSALFRWEEAERNHKLYGDLLNRRAEQALYAARTGYRSGDVSFADLIDSQRQWLAFQLNHQRALADILVWRAQLDTLTGGSVVQPEEGDRHE